MVGVDYMQVVSGALDDRLNELEELRDAVRYLISTWEDCSRKVKDEHINLTGDAETWLESLEDEIRETEREIDKELNSVSASYCD